MTLRVVLSLVCVLASAAASAQQPPPAVLSLTLEEAVSRGLAASHRIDEAAARHDASASVVDERHAATLPQIAALAGYMRTNHIDPFGIVMPNGQFREIYPDIPDNYRSRLDLQYPLYTGGRLGALTEAARKESSATANDIDTVRVDLRLEITRAFWAVVVAGESLRVVNESLTRMDAHLRDVRNQLTAGLVPPSDVLSAEAQQSREQMLSIQAQTARDLAEADLVRLIGGDPGSRVEPKAVLEPVVVDDSFDTLMSRARQQRPDRQALVDRLGAADFRYQAAAAGKRPLIGFAAGVDYSRPNPRIFPRVLATRDSWDVGVNVSWPLIDGGRTSAESAEAAATRRSIEARIDELDSMIALEIRQRLAEIASSRATITAADAAIRAATEAHRVIGERFAAGVATSTDVLDAQILVLQAALERTQALANAHLAEARLQRAIGQ